ncbi:heat-shock protein [Saccharobesus litoralis]|uniref:Heat-shock protein n=1 Tax=Saccharobesus litoralis TaxID=2172099 RepID=A0A2S0VMW9_9ALTE|nr:Hsp20 family protein [Saccharobesus litoralis]AWB65568.1 heat-shock protein [Saccharobesus litoralis]
MNSIDLTPLYRNSVGFDRFANLVDSALNTESVTTAYPPYNIEVLDDNRYAITLAVAGFELSHLDIVVEKNILSVKGKKPETDEKREYLYHGIATRTFERKFHLADFVEVSRADLDKGLLTIELVKEVPEAMKPKMIEINQPAAEAIEHKVA